MTQPHVAYRGNQIASAVPLDTTHANGFATAGFEKCWSRLDHCRGGMHDVFIVISAGGDGEHVARMVFAASEDDARQTHQEHYVGETIVEVQQETIAASHI